MEMRLTWSWCLCLSACLSMSLINFWAHCLISNKFGRVVITSLEILWEITGLIAKTDSITVPSSGSYNVGSCLIRFQIFHKIENASKCLICRKSFKLIFCHLRHHGQSTTIYKYTGDVTFSVPMLTKSLVGCIFFLYQRLPSAVLFHVGLHKISLILDALFICSCTM